LDGVCDFVRRDFDPASESVLSVFTFRIAGVALPDSALQHSHLVLDDARVGGKALARAFIWPSSRRDDLCRSLALEFGEFISRF
jgi:hypothetical protein